MNPYAVGLEPTHPSQPIRFHGTMTAEDVLIGSRNTAPKGGLRKLRSTFIQVIAFAALSFVIVDATLRFNGDKSFLPLLIGMGLTVVWLPIARRLSPHGRRSRMRLQTALQNLQERSGWLNDQFFVETSQNRVLRAKWRMFSKSLVFPNHLLLPQAADPTRRHVIPLRFFGSFEDAIGAIRIVQNEIGCSRYSAPKEADFVASVSSEELSAIDTDAAETWNDQHWPFPSNVNRHSCHSLDLTKGKGSLGLASLTSVTLSAQLAWFFLPMFAGVLVWLVKEHQRFGGFDFIYFQTFETWLFLAPIVVCLGVVLTSACVILVAALRMNSTPLEVSIRAEGLHISNAHFDSWIPAHGVMDVAHFKKKTRIVLRESGDPFDLLSGYFIDHAAFVNFNVALSELGFDPKVPH